MKLCVFARAGHGFWRKYFSYSQRAKNCDMNLCVFARAGHGFWRKYFSYSQRAKNPDMKLCVFVRAGHGFCRKYFSHTYRAQNPDISITGENRFFFGKWWGEALGQVRAVSCFGRRVVQLATLWRGRVLGTFGPKKANVRSFLGLRGAMVDFWGAGLAKVRGWILDGFWGWRGSQGSRCRERLGEPMRARGAKAQRATNASLIYARFRLLGLN